MEGSRAPRRWLLWGAAVVVVVAVVALVVWRLVLRDQSRPVSVGEALVRFRESSPSTVQPTVSAQATTEPAAVGTSTTVAAAVTVAPTSRPTTMPPPSSPPSSPPPPSLVEPGVYRYRTVGGESIDALDGARHDYPAETTMTVTPNGCGVHVRWDALEERRDEWSLCASARGIELQPEGLQYHEFFGQSDSEAVVCDRAAVVVPSYGLVAPTTLSCHLADDPWTPTWEVLGTGTRTVEGATVDTVHVRMTITDDDEYWEHTTVDWHLTMSGLVVEASSTKASSSPSPIGPVRYDESYHLELVSLTPLR